MVVFQDAVAKKAHYRKFGIAARRARTTSRPWPRSVAPVRPAPRSVGGGVRRGLRGAAEPRGRSTAARGSSRRRLRRCRLRPAARRGDPLAKREEESSCPGCPTRSCSTAARRAPAPPADPRRGASLRPRLPPAAARRAPRVDLRRAAASGRPDGGRSSSTSAPRSDPRGDPGGGQGVPGLPAKTARAIYAQLHKAGRG